MEGDSTLLCCCSCCRVSHWCCIWQTIYHRTNCVSLKKRRRGRAQQTLLMLIRWKNTVRVGAQTAHRWVP